MRSNAPAAIERWYASDPSKAVPYATLGHYIRPPGRRLEEEEPRLGARKRRKIKSFGLGTGRFYMFFVRSLMF